MANQADIAAVLQQSGVSVYGLQVSDAAGKTTVTGTVGTEAERQKAQQAITRVATDAQVTLQVNAGFADTSASAAPATTYTVKPGDNLRKIAKHVYGDEMKWRQILEANQGTIRDPDKIQVGMQLTIP